MEETQEVATQPLQDQVVEEDDDGAFAELLPVNTKV